MGVVFLARDTKLDRAVAIKALPPELSRDADRLMRFQREARVLASLNHPGVGAIYGLEEAGGHHYLILEFVEGETLADRLRRGAIPLGEALEIIGRVAAALRAAHDKGIVHRDVKPGNVMLTPGGGVKVLDFGIARTADEAAPAATPDSPTVATPLRAASPTVVGAIMGTAGYMSPEQARGKVVDARSDVFSLGCVFYEMLTGTEPFGGETVAESIGATIHKDIDLNRLPADVPEAIRDLIRRCVAKDPAHRCPSAGSIVEELEALRRWARDKAVPELAKICDRILVLEEGRDSWTAFELAREIERVAPNEPMVERLRPEFSNQITITSDPPGARAFASFYGDPADRELSLGHTPLRDMPFPRGLSVLRLELAGHRQMRDLIWNIKPGVSNASDVNTSTWHYRLHRPDEIPQEMEVIPAGERPVLLPGLDHMEAEPIAAFLMDRHPVTNCEFKRFVDDGGYRWEEFWCEPFLVGDRVVSRAEAMSLLTDGVGQPGPARWEMGEYPPGEGEHPVSGVSWYEAAAYAAWAGKSLPTIFHWSRAALTSSSGQMAPLANFGGRGTVPVGSTRSVNRYGVHDLAGNVREWILNPVDRPGQRFILGGGWNDPNYAFVDAFAQPMFDRSPANGFRCIRVMEPEPNWSRLARVIPVAFRDFRAETPVPDAVFEFFKRQFQYDRGPLNAVVVSDSASPAGRWQTVEIDAAYNAERMQVHVFLPERGNPPYQTVMLFPGSLALHTRIFNLSEIRRVDFLVRSGRAVLLPVYKGTFERGCNVDSDYPSKTAAYRDHLVMWAKDLGRAIDLAESRQDLDCTRLAYYGVSWGGALGAILPAVEPRIRANILYVAGLHFQQSLPEADQINYITRVTQPTLMLNGELDFFFPSEHSQRPMFDLLGTPAEHKRRLTYERGHTVPKTELIRESLAWLDRYFGPAG